MSDKFTRPFTTAERNRILADNEFEAINTDEVNSLNFSGEYAFILTFNGKKIFAYSDRAKTIVDLIGVGN